MATTTATITLSSTDLLSDELALSTTSTLTTAGTATGLTQTTGLARKKLASGHAQYELLDGSDYTDDRAGKLYLKNTSTNAAEYFEILLGTVGSTKQLGRLFAGDWAFFPYMGSDDGDIRIDPSAANMVLEWMFFEDQ